MTGIMKDKLKNTSIKDSVTMLNKNSSNGIARYLLLATASIAIANAGGIQGSLAADAVPVESYSQLNSDHWGLGRGLLNGDNITINSYANLIYTGRDNDFHLLTNIGTDGTYLGSKSIKNPQIQKLILGDLVTVAQSDIYLTLIDVTHNNISTNNFNNKINLVFHNYQYTSFDGNYECQYSSFTVTGNDISALGDIKFGTSANGGNGIMTFQNKGDTSFDELIYSYRSQGSVIVNSNITFTNKIGVDSNGNMLPIASLRINDNKHLKLKNNIVVSEISLIGPNAQLTIDSANNDILLNGSINIINYTADNEGIINFSGGRNIKVNSAIGDTNNRLANINILNNTNVSFVDKIFAKNIAVGNGNIEFKDDLDMFTRDGGGVIQDRGGLNFNGDGTVTFSKAFHSDITTTTSGEGSVMIMEPNNLILYNQIGELNNKLKSVRFLATNIQPLNDIYTDSLELRNTQTLSIGDGLTVGQITDEGTIKFTGDGYAFIDHANFTGKIINDNANKGKLGIAGLNLQLANQIVPVDKSLKSIDFTTADANILISSNNIYTNELNFVGANQTLTIDDGINFNWAIKTTTSGQGSIILGGANPKLQNQIGEDGKGLKSISFPTAGANIRLSSNDIYADELNLGDVSQVLDIDDGVIMTTPITGSGTINFAGDGYIFIDNRFSGKITTDNASKGMVEVAGVNLQLTNPIGISAVKHLKSIDFVTPAANIQLSTNDIYALELNLSDINQTLTLDDNIDFHGAIKGNGAISGTVKFAGRSVAKQIGEANARMAKIEAGYDKVSFTEPVYVDVIEINGAGPVEINSKNLSVTHILMNDPQANVTINEGPASITTIQAAQSGYGTITVNQSSVLGAIGAENLPVNKVIFAAAGGGGANNAIYSLYGNIYTNDIVFDNGEYRSENDNIKIVVSPAPANIPNGWVYSATENAVLPNAGHSAANPVEVPALDLRPRGDSGNGGAGNPPPVDAANADDANGGAGNPPPADAGTTNTAGSTMIDEFREILSDISSANSSLNSLKSYVSYAQTYVNEFTDILNEVKGTSSSTNILTVLNNDLQKINNIISTVQNVFNIISSQEKVTIHSDSQVESTSNEGKAMIYLLNMATLSEGARKNVQDKTQEVIKSSAQVGAKAVETAHSAISARQNSLGKNIGAGDETITIQGVWVSGLYGVSKQQEDKQNSGYNGHVFGGTIGSDFALNEDNTIGIAFSNIRSDFKYKQKRSGDKVNANSYILSFYSTHQLTGNFSLNTVLSAGKGNITNRRLFMDKVATGKIKNTNYNARLAVSYHLPANGIHIVPTIGINYGSYHDKAYTESGVGVHNLAFGAKSTQLFSTIWGTDIAMPIEAGQNWLVTPFISMYGENYLNNKQQKVKAKFTWMNDYFANSPDTAKKQKVQYNLGGGINSKTGNFEASLDYNYQFYNKYQSHQGVLKLKLLF